MSPTDYFRQRRSELRKRRLCVRCGSFPKARGHSLCAACIEEKKLKRSDDSTARNRRRIEKRVEKIEGIRAALLRRIS